MNKETDAAQGLQLIVEKCRDDFRRPENTDHYDQQDYKDAERKYVKYCLHGTGPS